MTRDRSTAPSLLLTITGIRRETVTAAERVRDIAREHGLRAGLVVTAHAPDWRLHDDSAALEFISDCVSRRHEVLLGGMGINPTKETPKKAEFHNLGRHESQLRLTAATRQLAALGLRPSVFAPDKWLASEEAMKAARAVGLTGAADAYSIRDLASGHRTELRVLAYGDGFGAARWWRKNVQRTVERKASKRADVRLSINAGKADRLHTIQDIERLIGYLADCGYQGRTYSDTVGHQRAAVA